MNIKSDIEGLPEFNSWEVSNVCSMKKKMRKKKSQNHFHWILSSPITGMGYFFVEKETFKLPLLLHKS